MWLSGEKPSQWESFRKPPRGFSRKRRFIIFIALLLLCSLPHPTHQFIVFFYQFVQLHKHFHDILKQTFLVYISNVIEVHLFISSFSKITLHSTLVLIYQFSHLFQVTRLNHDKFLINIEFVPTVPHCSLATLIGLCIRVKLSRSLVCPYKADINIAPGTHNTEVEGECCIVFYYHFFI